MTSSTVFRLAAPPAWLWRNVSASSGVRARIGKVTL
jgi:hypothetical protein